MKVLAIILVSFICCAQSIRERELLEEWGKFQEKYGKTYRSPLEARKRMVIFNKNLKDIRAHNVLYQLGETTFKKGINRFSDWTQDEFMQYLNKGSSKKSTEKNGKIFKKTEGIELPESVDWREKGVVRDVKDQGDCGSCWSFSVTGAIEGQYSIVKNENVSLSEQNLVDCDIKYNLGCSGGWTEYAFDYIKKNGIESEKDYPYEAKDGDCKGATSKTYKISGYEQIPEGDEEALKEVVALKGPVSICLYASENFHSYSSGILKENCPQFDTNHCILVVGYGSENGLDYYIVKNSWGADWGEEGYIRMARNYNNMCGIASDANIPVV